jgi:hypothetical protein
VTGENDAPARAAARACLAAVTDRFGASILSEARRFEAAAADAFGPDHRKERAALCNAVHAGIPKALRAERAEHVPRAMAVAELAERLADETAMDAAMARWAVEALADAVGLQDDADGGAVDRTSEEASLSERGPRGLEIDLRPRGARTVALIFLAIVVAIALGGAALAWSRGWNPFVVQ